MELQQLAQFPFPSYVFTSRKHFSFLTMMIRLCHIPTALTAGGLPVRKMPFLHI